MVFELDVLEQLIYSFLELISHEDLKLQLEGDGRSFIKVVKFESLDLLWWYLEFNSVIWGCDLFKIVYSALSSHFGLHVSYHGSDIAIYHYSSTASYQAE